MTNNKTNLIQKNWISFFYKNQLSALRLVTIGVLVIGVDNGAWTHSIQIGSLALYQLSYIHILKIGFYLSVLDNLLNQLFLFLRLDKEPTLTSDKFFEMNLQTLVEYLLPLVITTILTQLHRVTWGASFQDLSTQTTIPLNAIHLRCPRWIGDAIGLRSRNLNLERVAC